MAEHLPFVDASVFLGMHHQDSHLRRRALAFFASYYRRGVRMNFEQVGICDAIIWQLRRDVQDAYYPFMDRLHSDMAILREGYGQQELELYARDSRMSGLRSDQALLALQVICNGAILFTLDPVLRRLPALKAHLGDFAALDAAVLPKPLPSLYATSRVYTHTDKDWDYVEARYFHPLDHPA
ncbi:DUF6190 family protein [Marinobacter lipolyticus]|uniref:DUF6190 family protein n=1 Tax=Marinobacter lipolyticus TaxID=209639 RepID=UPI0029FB5D09|nr:DUF6190 family protein [Marinobacter sp.]